MFVEACSSYLSDPRTRGRLKPSTLRAYRKDFAAASAALPQPLEQITASDLTLYLAGPIAPSTAARRLAALRALFGWAAREGYIAGDLTAHGTLEELQALNHWLGTLPHRHKLVIAGNHDWVCAERPELVPATWKSSPSTTWPALSRPRRRACRRSPSRS
jgi:Phage integrase, N-terminal SAM-like domain